MHTIPHSVRVALVDERPLVVLGVSRAIETRAAELAVTWTASSVDEAQERMNENPPDVVVASGPTMAYIHEQVRKLAAMARALVVLDRDDPRLEECAIMAGARGVVDLGYSPELLIRAIRKVHEGEFWLDRAAASRFLGRVARPGPRAESSPALPAAEELSRRGPEILHAMVVNAGLGAKEIADKLGTSESTLRNHLTSIYGKLGVSSRVELFAYAHRHGLVPLHRVA